jgi:Ca-activated chloride channel family protein
MAKTLKYSGTVAAVLLALLSTSCRDSVPAARVLSGNMSYARGQYQKSILQYLSAENTVAAGKDVVYYNLANVYYALGEGDAALRTWALSEENTDNLDILFRITFNRGVLYYNRGRFDEAYRSFRRALTLVPSDIDAKINLEDSLSRIRTTVPPAESAGEGENDESDTSSRRLLDYVRRKEADAWSGQAAEYDESVEDW